MSNIVIEAIRKGDLDTLKTFQPYLTNMIF